MEMISKQIEMELKILDIGLDFFLKYDTLYSYVYILAPYNPYVVLKLVWIWNMPKYVTFKMVCIPTFWNVHS